MVTLMNMTSSNSLSLDSVNNRVRFDPDVLIGRMIGHLRRANGLSIKELAASAYLDEVHLASIEVGISALDFRTAEAVAPVLGVQASDIHASVECIVRFLDAD